MVFTCCTEGAQAWESNEYIGLGRQLAFGPDDNVGYTKFSETNSQIYATITQLQLDDNDNDDDDDDDDDETDDGGPLIESKLHLTVSPMFPTFMIVCRNVDKNFTDSVKYLTNGN